jgi:hypothetical protein
MAKKTIHQWLSSAANRDNIEYILSVDSTDPLLAKYEAFAADMGVLLHIGDNKAAIEAINSSARLAANNFYLPDLLVVCSDDFSCPYHWDKALVKALEGKRDYIVKVDDGAQPWIMTLPIMHIDYYKRFGYVYHPSYGHLFADTEMSHVGHILGKVITLPITFKHLHYTTGAMAKDAINAKNDATWAQGEQTYLDRLLNHFDIPETDRVNPINHVHASHLQWLDSKGVRFNVCPA